MEGISTDETGDDAAPRRTSPRKVLPTSSFPPIARWRVVRKEFLPSPQKRVHVWRGGGEMALCGRTLVCVRMLAVRGVLGEANCDRGHRSSPRASARPRPVVVVLQKRGVAVRFRHEKRTGGESSRTPDLPPSPRPSYRHRTAPRRAQHLETRSVALRLKRVEGGLTAAASATQDLTAAAPSQNPSRVPRRAATAASAAAAASADDAGGASEVPTNPFRSPSSPSGRDR